MLTGMATGARRKPRGAETLPTTLRTFGQLVRSARLAAKLTQQDLADRVGVTKSAVSEWERDQVGSVSLSNAMKLEAELGVSADELLRVLNTAARFRLDRALMDTEERESIARARLAQEWLDQMEQRQHRDLALSDETLRLAQEIDRLDRPLRAALRALIDVLTGREKHRSDEIQALPIVRKSR